MRVIIFGFWVILTFNSILLSSSSIRGLTVLEVDFNPKKQPLPSNQLSVLVATKPGEQFSARLVRQTIHNLYATGRYQDIEVEAERVGEGVRLVFITTPSWFIGLIEVTGVPNPPSVGHLVNVTELRVGERYSEGKKARAKQQIHNLLRENGFHLADIKVIEKKHPEYQQIDLIFRINTSERADIGEIIFTPDPQLMLSGSELRRIAKWRKGKDFTQQLVHRGLARIKSYLQRHQRWQAQARKVELVHDPDTNRTDVVLHIVPGPNVMVRIDGADFSPLQLQKYLPIFKEGSVDEDLLAEGANNLRNHLQSQGYFSAAVEHFLERNSSQEVRIVYAVTKGPRQRLSKIRIAGNLYFDLETIRERLLVSEKTFQNRRGQFSENLLKRDVNAIEKLYRTNGFQKAKVESKIVTGLGTKKANLTVLLEIEEGPLTLVSDLTILGSQRVKVRELLPELSSARGQPFSEINIAADRDLILRLYYDAGFQDARFSWQYAATDTLNRVSVEYKIEEGARSRVLRPIVSGLRHTRKTLVNRQISISPGEPLLHTAMLETQKRLYNLGVFSKVNVDLQNPEGNELHKNVLVQVEESNRWSVGVGGGAEFARIGGNTGDLTSPVGDASFSPRVTLELTRLNLLGKAHTASLRTRFSDLQQRALFTYENPRLHGSDRWRMTVSSLFDTSRNVRTFTGRRLEGAFQLHQKLSKPSTALYRFIYRRTRIDENTLQITPGLIPRASQSIRVGLLGATYIQDRRDEPTDATRGLYNTIDFGVASRMWASEPNFVRFLGQNSSYHRLPGRLVVARTLQLGLMLPWGQIPQVSPGSSVLDDFARGPDSRIPLSERFFFGGANSHRGFPINQAGPRDPITGFPIGGGAVLLSSLELRFPLVGENIGGVLFHDAGNAYSKPSRISFRSQQKAILLDNQVAEYDFDYMVHAVGFGLRYRTPIGPVRLDLGYSINPPHFIGFDGTRAELLNGQGVITQQRISHFQFQFSLGQTF